MNQQINILKPFQTPKRIGLLAGGGQFPIVFAKAAKRQGHSVYCMGVQGMVSDELEDLCTEYAAASLGRIGRTIRFFKRAKVDSIVMAGKVEKTVLFRKFTWIYHLPDWRAFHMLFRYAAKDKKDDTLLLAVIKEFGRDNLKFESALEYCPELLVNHGFLTRRRPSQSQWKDIHFGWDIAKKMGHLDIGQTIVVRDTAVIAVEAIEGTDAAIRRAGQLCKRGGFSVIKVAKPQQDMRFDVPTIGVNTLQSMRESGGRVLAIESDKTILIDQEAVLNLAEKLGISIVSLKSNEMELKIAS